MSRTKAAGAIILLALAPALTGCAGSIAEKLDEFPRELINDSIEQEEGPDIAWSDDGAYWLVLTVGSSSCPWEPRELTQTSPTSYEITLDRAGWIFCTADATHAVHRIPAPTTRGEELTVDLGPGIQLTM